MQSPDGLDTLHNIWFLLRVRLMDHTFVSHSIGAGLVGVDPGDDEDLLFDCFLDPGQPGNIITDRILIMGGAGTDNEQEQLFSLVKIPLMTWSLSFLSLVEFLRKRHGIQDFLRGRYFSNIFEAHDFSLYPF